MNPVKSLLESPVLFWSIASVLSIYYGVRGVVYQKHYVGSPETLNVIEKIIVQYAQDFIYNFISCMAATHGLGIRTLPRKGPVAQGERLRLELF